MNTMGIFWLGVMILAAVVEAAVPSLVSVWFVPGGLAALIVSLLGGQLWLQAAVFLAVSAIALALTRPLSKLLDVNIGSLGHQTGFGDMAAEPPPGAHQRRPGGGGRGPGYPRC